MIEYLGGTEPRPAPTPDVEFVGGPRAGERVVLTARPEMISGAGGVYRRSVACADDGAQRYVWSSSPTSSVDPNEPHETGLRR
jgi:hypothetical protein